MINFITNSPPIDFTESGVRLGSRVKLTFASAAREKRTRTEVYGATPRLRFILGGSFRDAEDARAGRGIGLQVPTSGRDLNWDLKTELRVNHHHMFAFALQNIDRDKVHRFYRPHETNYNDRLGTTLKYDGKKIFSGSDHVNLVLYYQYKKDARENLEKGETYWTKTKTYASDLQWSNLFGGNHLMTSGIHFERDDGECPDDEQFTRHTASGIRKDAPDSYWTNYAVYFQDEWELILRMRLALGLRWDLFDFESRPDSFYVPPAGVDPSIGELDEQENTLTGGLGISYSVTNTINLLGNLSRDFRQYAPVFGIKQHGYGIQVPSGLLNPAAGMNYDLGVKMSSATLKGSAIAFYSNLRDFPVVVRTTFQGQDWYDWDNSGTRDVGEDVYAMENAARAYVYGIEIEGEYNGGSGWSIHGGFNWNYGKDRTNDEPLRHTIPAWGVLKAGWNEPGNHRFWFEFSTEMAAPFDRIPADRIYRDPGYRTDPQDMESPLIGPNGEVPGWVIFNMRGEYKVDNQVALNVAIENFTDKAYRRVHSRWDELGINFVLGLTFTL